MFCLDGLVYLFFQILINSDIGAFGCFLVKFLFLFFNPSDIKSFCFH